MGSPTAAAAVAAVADPSLDGGQRLHWAANVLLEVLSVQVFVVSVVVMAAERLCCTLTAHMRSHSCFGRRHAGKLVLELHKLCVLVEER